MLINTGKLSAVILALGLLITKSASAETSSQYAKMGLEVWSAFECSALAEKSKYPQEQERLFKFGHAQGVKFIRAIQAGKVEQADLSANVPIGLLLRLQGPTPDFMLGRIFEGAVETGLRGVYKTGDQFNSEELQTVVAQNKFRKQNCKLIGK